MIYTHQNVHYFQAWAAHWVTGCSFEPQLVVKLGRTSADLAWCLLETGKLHHNMDNAPASGSVPLALKMHQCKLYKKENTLVTLILPKCNFHYFNMLYSVTKIFSLLNTWTDSLHVLSIIRLFFIVFILVDLGQIWNVTPLWSQKDDQDLPWPKYNQSYELY